MRNIIKIAVAVLIIAAAVPMRGQEWKFVTLPADELLGQDEMEAAVFNTDDYTCVVSFTHDRIMVTSNDGIFDYHKREYYVHVGLYDTIGNLVEKYSQFCYGDAPVNYTIFKFTNPDPFFGRNRPKVVDKVNEWLSCGEGYVRIVAPRFQRSNMEIVLPCDRRFVEWIKKKE